MEEYLRIMKTNVYNLSQDGSPVPRRALILKVLLGLDEVYNPVIAVIQEKQKISWPDMQSELLIFLKEVGTSKHLKEYQKYCPKCNCKCGSKSKFE